MNIPDYVKENLYLPYFRRFGSRARAQQVLLGIGVTLLAAGALIAVVLWKRRKAAASIDEQAD